MGNATSRARVPGKGSRHNSVNILESFCKPTGAYASTPSPWDATKHQDAMKQLIFTGKLAPRVLGADEASEDVSVECLICLSSFAGEFANSTTCCSASICSECYLHTQNPSEDAPCPFCMAPNFKVSCTFRLKHEIRRQFFGLGSPAVGTLRTPIVSCIGAQAVPPGGSSSVTSREEGRDSGREAGSHRRGPATHGPTVFATAADRAALQAQIMEQDLHFAAMNDSVRAARQDELAQADAARARARRREREARRSAVAHAVLMRADAPSALRHGLPGGLLTLDVLLAQPHLVRGMEPDEVLAALRAAAVMDDIDASSSGSESPPDGSDGAQWSALEGGTRGQGEGRGGGREAGHAARARRRSAAELTAWEDALLAQVMEESARAHTQNPSVDV